MSPMTCPRCWGSQRDPDVGGPCRTCAGAGQVPDQQLSPHFRLSELLASETAARKGIANDPTPEIVNALGELARDLLEPLRARFGAIRITSGYRSPALNAALSGSSKTSVHPLGHAADLNPMGADVTRRQIVDWFVASSLPFDQVIFEGTWVHVGRHAPTGGARRQALMMFPGQGGPQYFPYDPADPRVAGL